MHDLDVQCDPSSFRIPELLSDGTALSITGVLAFYRVVSVDTMRCRSTSLFAVSTLLRLYDVIIQNVATSRTTSTLQHKFCVLWGAVCKNIISDQWWV